MRKSTTYHYSEGGIRQFVKNELKTTNNRIDTLENRIDALGNRVETLLNQFNEFKNKVYELLDKVVGELKAMREEQTIIVGYKDQIENHETRIGKLEDALESSASSP